MTPRRLLAFLSALVLTVAAGAQTYVGSLTTNSYTQKDATMVVTLRGTAATLEMRHVKFAKLMPVKVDVEVKGLNASTQSTGTTLNGDNIVPLSNGKPHKKYTIYKYAGKMSPTTLTFDCLMGEKKVSFKGKLSR